MQVMQPIELDILQQISTSKAKPNIKPQFCRHETNFSCTRPHKKIRGQNRTTQKTPIQAPRSFIENDRAYPIGKKAKAANLRAAIEV
ncbi:hypothetical protein SLA2020_523520 [Shorea laevis]